jgi:hypothetical protein
MFDVPPKLKWLEKSVAASGCASFPLMSKPVLRDGRSGLNLPTSHLAFLLSFRWQARRYHAPC